MKKVFSITMIYSGLLDLVYAILMEQKSNYTKKINQALFHANSLDTICVKIKVYTERNN